MDWTAIIVSLIGVFLGGSGLSATILSIVLKRKYEKEDRTDKIMKSLEELQKKSNMRDIEISKLQISNLIEHSPKDHRAIQDEMDRYFLILHGDSWVFDKVSKWAGQESVNIDYIRIAHEQNLKKKGER